MARLTFPVSRDGLIVPVWIGLSGQETTTLLAAGHAVPPPLKVRGLLDTGSDVTADLQIVGALPDTPYDVRLIEMPRASSASCNAGDPGVAAAVLQTDDGGAGGVTVSDPISPGATGMWMFISRPGELSQTPAEFYTSDFVVPL